MVIHPIQIHKVFLCIDTFEWLYIIGYQVRLSHLSSHYKQHLCRLNHLQHFLNDNANPLVQEFVDLSKSVVGRPHLNKRSSNSKSLFD